MSQGCHHEPSFLRLFDMLCLHLFLRLATYWPGSWTLLPALISWIGRGGMQQTFPIFEVKDPVVMPSRSGTVHVKFSIQFCLFTICCARPSLQAYKGMTFDIKNLRQRAERVLQNTHVGGPVPQ